MNNIESPIIIGCDHAAYEMKEKIKSYLINQGIEVEDAGTYNEESVDYSDFAIKVARSVSNGSFARGILICGTGVGMSLAANRFSGVRATLCNDLFSAVMSRQHNDSNILVMGGRVIGDVLATEITRIWLETPFEGGRHQKRIDKFDMLGETVICL
ncbi:Ribose-5-phosphate isomerase B [Candidatus Magnetomoraceae bacterium gMMP-1]